MIIEFSVGNFLSFKDKKTFSLEASAIKDEPLENVIRLPNYHLLRSAAIYGANSSGKSNLTKAFGAMSLLVLDSVRLNDGEEMIYDPFLLCPESQDEPSHFEIIFLLKNKQVRYGFENSQSRIVREWLFVKEDKTKEKPFFIRSIEGIGVDGNNYPEAVDKEEHTNDNRLFVSLVAQLGGPFSKEIMEWFKVGYSTLSGLSNRKYSLFSKIMLLKKQSGYHEALALLEKLQLGFSKIYATEEEPDLSDLSKEARMELEGKKTIKLYTVHKKYDHNGTPAGEEIFNFGKRESSGTRKIIDLIGPIFDSLLNGRTLIVDELDAKMHVLISLHIIKLFNDPEINTKNAQLIFTTHDTHLLSSKLLRRDQIWFTEKDEKESTDLYQLTDITFADGSKPRNDSNYEKNYINGRYGAIPYIR